MSKISWSKALIDYLSDETASYASIAQKYGVSVQAVKKRASKEGWQNLRTKTIQKVDQKLPEKLGEEIAEINTKHAQIGRTLTEKGLNVLEANNLNPKSYGEAKESIKDGIRIEREALNINSNQPPAVAIQINFGSKEINEWAS